MLEYYHSNALTAAYNIYSLSATSECYVALKIAQPLQRACVAENWGTERIHALSTTESVRNSQEMGCRIFQNFLIRKEKNHTKPLQSCEDRAWTSQMLAEVRSSAVTRRSQAPCSVSIMCQQQDKVMLRSAMFCSTFLTPDSVLVNIIDYTLFNFYLCFCGNILKLKFLVMKEEGNMEVKRKQKKFIMFIFASLLRVNQESIS